MNFTPAPIRPSRTNSPSVSKPHFGLRLVFAGLVAFVGLGYLILSNHVATKGFQVKELQTRSKELEQTHARLEVNVMELSSLSSVQEATERLGLVHISSLDYLSSADPTVALSE